MNLGSIEVDQEASHWKEELYVGLLDLSARYGWVKGGRAMTTTLVKTLSENTCERRILHLLSNGGERDAQKFDRYYSLKHEFAKEKIIEHLQWRLAEAGQKAFLSTEVKTDYSVNDVRIVSGTPCQVLRGTEKICLIEIKSSLGFILEQLERELWGDVPVILARVPTAQVVKLRPSDLGGYIAFSTKGLAKKTERLLKGDGVPIPGPACFGCKVAVCEFKEDSKQTAPRPLITPTDVEFGKDLKAFFRNLAPTATRVADMVLEELGGKMCPEMKS